MPNQNKLQTLCVFCGSKPGSDPGISVRVAELGQTLAQQQRTLLYGGSSSGLMGVLADAVIAQGGEVIGVMPVGSGISEQTHPHLQQLIEVADLSQRKQMMLAKSDGFIALPGGTGTLDELFEVFTLSQLGVHRKPCGLLNINGFFDPLLQFLQQVCDQGFMHPDYLKMLLVAETPVDLLASLDQFQHPHTH